MEGFNKIDLETAPSQPANPVIVSNRPKSKTRRALPKKSLIILAVITVVIIVFGLILVAPVQKTYSDAKATFEQVKVTVNALKKQNISLASSELDKTKESLTQTQKSLDAMGYLKFIPIANMSIPMETKKTISPA